MHICWFCASHYVRFILILIFYRVFISQIIYYITYSITWYNSKTNFVFLLFSSIYVISIPSLSISRRVIPVFLHFSGKSRYIFNKTAPFCPFSRPSVCQYQDYKCGIVHFEFKLAPYRGSYFYWFYANLTFKTHFVYHT